MRQKFHLRKLLADYISSWKWKSRILVEGVTRKICLKGTVTKGFDFYLRFPYPNSSEREFEYRNKIKIKYYSFFKHTVWGY
jgi:hypothetical protein